MREVLIRFPLLILALILSSPLAAATKPPATGTTVVRDHDIVPEDYFSLVSIISCATSPDGSRVAYTEQSWGEADERRDTDLWVVDTACGSRRRLTFDGVGAASPRWSPDGQIYFTAEVERSDEERPPYNGTSQVWRISPDGGEPFPVTRVADGVELFALAGGETLYYVTGEEVTAGQWQQLQEEYSGLEYGHGVETLSAVWALDLESWRTEKVVEAQRVVHDLALSPDHRNLAMITSPEEELVTHEGWSRVEVLDVGSGELRVLTSAEWRRDHPSPYGWLHDLAWSSDSGALAFAVSYDGYPTEIHLAEWRDGDRQDSRVRRLQRSPEISVSGDLQWLPGTRDLCFRGEEQARVRIYCCEGLRDGGQGATLAVTRGDVAVDAFSLAAEAEVMALVLGTTTVPQDLYLFTPESELRRLTRINPQVDTWRLPQISLVSWQATDGSEVAGILELPPDHRPGDGPLPMVVELHGGPSSSTLYRLRFWIYGRTLLAARGFALLSPNYRGSTGYGDRFMTGLIGRENDIEVGDILAGVDAMVERGIADGNRLAVMGWSNGGLLTNCLITQTDRFTAASSGAGVLDMVFQWGIEDTPGHVINFMGGLPWQKPDAYHAASALYALHRVATPTLIHVGADDARVPAAHSRTLFRALHRYLHVPTQLVVYPDEGHSLAIRKHRLAKMKWDLAWFGRYLSPATQPADPPRDARP